MMNKIYIKLIPIIIVIIGLTGLLAYQIFSNHEISNDEITENLNAVKNENIPLVEQVLNQFAQYGKEKKYDEAILIVSDEMGEQLRSMKQKDFEYFFSVFREYEKLIITYVELGDFVPNNLGIQYRVEGMLVYANDNSLDFEAIVVDDGKELKIYGIQVHGEVKNSIDEDDLSNEDVQIIQQLDRDTEQIRIVLNQFIEYGLESKYNEAIALLSDEFKETFKNCDQSCKDAYFSNISTGFKEFQFDIDTNVSMQTNERYELSGNIIYEKEIKKFEAVIIKVNSEFKIDEFKI